MHTPVKILVAVLPVVFFSCGIDASTSDSDGSSDSVASEVKKKGSLTARDCGGFMGLSCLPGEVCMDVAGDACDPAKGGRDCKGTCMVPTGAACGGAAAVACGATQFCLEATEGAPRTLAASGHAGVCAKSPVCGGFAHLACPGGYDCIDDPSDSCDPKKGGHDCSGLCVTATTSAP